MYISILSTIDSLQQNSISSDFKFLQFPVPTNRGAGSAELAGANRTRQHIRTHPLISCRGNLSQLGPLGALGRLGCRLTFHPFGSWYVLTWTLGNSTGYSSPMHM